MSAYRVLLNSARLQLFAPGSGSHSDLRAWIANQKYSVMTSISPTAFTLVATDSSDLVQSMANDCNRLACAAFESAAGVGPDHTIPNSLAWGSIRSYYSAFFAAHGVMRLFGSACIQLDKEHVVKVFEAARAYGQIGAVASLDSGFYRASIDPAFGQVTFCRLKNPHLDTWATFLSVLTSVKDNVSTTPGSTKNKMIALEILDDLRFGLTLYQASNGNWLSTFRNAINYRQSNGVWFPHARTSQGELLNEASRLWKVSHPSSRISMEKTDVRVFLAASMCLVSLLRELVISASSTYPKVNAVFENGSLRLLRQVTA